MKTSSSRSASPKVTTARKAARAATSVVPVAPVAPVAPARAKTAAVVRQGPVSGMSAAERAEFVRTWKRELSQRSDPGSASARSSRAR